MEDKLSSDSNNILGLSWTAPLPPWTEPKRNLNCEFPICCRPRVKTLRLSWLSKQITADVGRTSSVALNSHSFRHENHCSSSVTSACDIFLLSSHIVFQELLPGEREPTTAHNWMYCLSLTFHFKWHWTSRFYSPLNYCTFVGGGGGKSCQTKEVEMKF